MVREENQISLFCPNSSHELGASVLQGRVWLPLLTTRHLEALILLQQSNGQEEFSPVSERVSRYPNLYTNGNYRTGRGGKGCRGPALAGPGKAPTWVHQLQKPGSAGRL